MTAIIFIISFLATLLSAMSGGGSAMITIPAWVFLGFPLPVALAANNVTGALWTPIAARNYLLASKLDWTLISGLILFGLIGAYTGTQVVLLCDQLILQRIFGVIILAVVGVTWLHQDFGVTPRDSRFNRFVSAVLALPLGFYETFFGSGNGLFSSAMLIKTRGFTLTVALGYYYIISFTWCSLGSFIYLNEGFGDWCLIIPSALAGVSGAYIGSRIGSKRGPRFIRKLFLIVGSILGLKLALGI